MGDMKGGSTSGGYPVVTKKDVPVKITVSDTAPSNPTPNQIWIDTSS